MSSSENSIWLVMIECVVCSGCVIVRYLGISLLKIIDSDVMIIRVKNVIRLLVI